MADTSVGMKRTLDLLQQLGFGSLGAHGIDRHTRLVPAAGPAEFGGGALDLGIPLREVRVVLGRDGARTHFTEGSGCEQLDFLNWFGRRSSLCRQRVARQHADPAQQAFAIDEMSDGVAADVADGTVSDPVMCIEKCAFGRLVARFAIAEAQMRAPVVVHFHDEVAVATPTGEQVISGPPDSGRLASGNPLFQTDFGQRRAGILREHCGCRRRCTERHSIRERRELQLRAERRGRHRSFYETALAGTFFEDWLPLDGTERVRWDAAAMVYEDDVAPSNADTGDAAAIVGGRQPR